MVVVLIACLMRLISCLSIHPFQVSSSQSQDKMYTRQTILSLLVVALIAAAKVDASGEFETEISRSLLLPILTDISFLICSQRK